MSGTLTGYEQLKAYWFNPKTKKVEVRLRPTKCFADQYRIDDLEAKLRRAREQLSGQR